MPTVDERLDALEKKMRRERLDTAGVNFDAGGNIPAAYQGTVTNILLKDFPILVRRVGRGADLARVKVALASMHLQCETFTNADGTGFAGFRFARVTGPPQGTTVDDIFWPVKITLDTDGVATDVANTFKCIVASAFKAI